MNFFDHKNLGNHRLQLCPKVVKHPVYIYTYMYAQTLPLAALEAVGNITLFYRKLVNYSKGLFRIERLIIPRSYRQPFSFCDRNYRRKQVLTKEGLNHLIIRKCSDYMNILKPNVYVTHQQSNIQQLYVLPTLYLCVLYLSEKKQRLVSLTA